jgi:hypothetical protein
MSGAQLYDTIGATYTVTRRTEPRIAAQIWAALGDAETVLNVGADTGSYEPPDRDVTAVEPSALMQTAESWSSDRSEKATSHCGKWPVKWVGLPGLEPGTSSLSGKAGGSGTMDHTCSHLRVRSTVIHRRPAPSRTVVTQFVTQ